MNSSENPFAEGKPPGAPQNTAPEPPQPYSQPPAKKADPFNSKIDPGDGSISYMRAWTFLTESENWVGSWLLLSVVSLVPYIGQIVVQGFLYNSFEGILRGYRSNLPEYKFERFGEDLKRGIWPWLVAFVIGIGMQVIIQPTSHLGMMGIMAAGQNMEEEAAVLFLAFFIPLVILVALGLSVLAMCVVTPMHLRSGLSQGFKEAFNFKWAKQFVSLVWVELLLAKLFLMVTGILAGLIGLGFCFVGVIFTTTFLVVATTFLDMQLYRLFLLRGGEPVPLKAPEPEIAQTWQQG